jgi:hypothetical protein
MAETTVAVIPNAIPSVDVQQVYTSHASITVMKEPEVNNRSTTQDASDCGDVKALKADIHDTFQTQHLVRSIRGHY